MLEGIFIFTATLTATAASGILVFYVMAVVNRRRNRK